MYAAPALARVSIRLRVVVAMIALSLLSAAAAQKAGGYEDQVAKWRRQFDADLIADGWLSLVGRERIPEGTSSLGSSAASTIVLPSPAPRRLGELTRRGAVFGFSPADNVIVLIDDWPATKQVQLPAEGKIKAGSLSLTVRQIAGDYYLSIQDADSPAIAAFKGTAWFPVDSSYRVTARFEPYDRPRQVELALTFESATRIFSSTGDVAFELRGRAL